MNVKGTKAVRTANIKPTKAGVSDTRTLLDCSLQVDGHFYLSLYRGSASEPKASLKSVFHIACSLHLAVHVRHMEFASSNLHATRHFVYFVPLLQPAGDEEIENATSNPPEAQERTQESLAFNDELDDLQYLKMKEGRIQFLLLFLGRFAFSCESMCTQLVRLKAV